MIDPASDSIVFSVEFSSETPGYQLYVYYDPSLANSGMHDTAWIEGRTLVSQDGSISSALTCGRCKFVDATNGFLGVNDGLTQLKQDGKIASIYPRAENGNVVQTARVEKVSVGGGPITFALSFAATPAAATAKATAALTKGWSKIYQEFQAGWIRLCSHAPRVEAKYQAQFDMAAMVLKAHEDKTYRGAMIAVFERALGRRRERERAERRRLSSRLVARPISSRDGLSWRSAIRPRLIARSIFFFKRAAKTGRKFSAELLARRRLSGDRCSSTKWRTRSCLRTSSGEPTTRLDEARPARSRLHSRERPFHAAGALGREERLLALDHRRRDRGACMRRRDRATQWRRSLRRISISQTADEWARNIETWTATTTGIYGDGNYYLRISHRRRPERRRQDQR